MSPESLRSNRSVAPLGVALLFALAATGPACAASIPEARFHVLASSGASILSTTTETYARIVRLEQAFIVASTGDDKLTVDSFRPAVEGKSFDLEPELSFRRAALAVLVKYLQVLEAFASSDGGAAVDQASLELDVAVASLMDAAAPSGAGAQVAGILATGIDAIGREITAGQRARALARVMDASQKDVERLAVLIARSHDKLDRAIDVMVGQVVARANLVRPAPATVARDEYYAALLVQLREAKEARTALADVAGAIGEVAAAHAQVRKSLDESRTPLDSLKALAHKAEQAGQFYGSLPKGVKNALSPEGAHP